MGVVAVATLYVLPLVKFPGVVQPEGSEKPEVRQPVRAEDEPFEIATEQDVVLAQIKAYERAVEFTKVFPGFKLGDADPEGKTELEKQVIEAGKDIPGSLNRLSAERDMIVAIVLQTFAGRKLEAAPDKAALRAELEEQKRKLSDDRKRLEQESAAADLKLFRKLKEHAAKPDDAIAKECLSLFEVAVEKGSMLVQCDLRLDWITMFDGLLAGQEVKPIPSAKILEKRTLKY